MSKKFIGRSLHVSDVIRLFTLYQASKLRLFEIVRTFHPHHLAALLYILDNTSCVKNREPVTLGFLVNGEDDDDTQHCDIIRSHYKTHITLNSYPIQHIRQLNASDGGGGDDDKYYIYTQDDPDLLTLMQELQDGKHNNNTNNDQIYESSSLLIRMLLHNLKTKLYKEFISNMGNHLLPSYLQSVRNEYRPTVDQTITEKFLIYYSMLMNQSLPINVNHKSFRCLFRKRPIQLLKPLRTQLYDDKWLLQPRLRGFLLVINTDGNGNTRCYNRWCEITASCLLNPERDKLKLSCTYEAVMLPVDERGSVRSWRIWNSRKSICLYVTDVFRIAQKMLIHLPFGERLQYIDQITKQHDKLFINNRLGSLIDEKIIEETYYSNIDLCNPISGIVYRRSNQYCTEAHREYQFCPNVIYDLKESKSQFVEGCFSLPRLFSLRYYIDLQFAEYCVVCLVYGHDKNHLMVAEFNRHTLQYEHVGRLERILTSPLCRDSNLKYNKSHRIYVVNAVVPSRGMLLVRVYYTSEKILVGMECKLTTSVYDVPYKSTTPLFNKL